MARQSKLIKLLSPSPEAVFYNTVLDSIYFYNEKVSSRKVGLKPRYFSQQYFLVTTDRRFGVVKKTIGAIATGFCTTPNRML